MTTPTETTPTGMPTEIQPEADLTHEEAKPCDFERGDSPWCPQQARWSCLFDWGDGTQEHPEVLLACDDHHRNLLNGHVVECPSCGRRGRLVEAMPI